MTVKVYPEKKNFVFIGRNYFPNGYAYLTMYNPYHNESGAEITLVLSETDFGDDLYFFESKPAIIVIISLTVTSIIFFIISCFCMWKTNNK